MKIFICEGCDFENGDSCTCSAENSVSDKVPFGCPYNNEWVKWREFELESDFKKPKGEVVR